MRLLLCVFVLFSMPISGHTPGVLHSMGVIIVVLAVTIGECLGMKGIVMAEKEELPNIMLISFIIF